MCSSIAARLRGLVACSIAGAGQSLNEGHIGLAVTGLSRAGKIAFITSLIDNLLALSQRHNSLPQLSKRSTQDGLSRMRSMTVMPAGMDVLPFFDYQTKLAGLGAEQPSWPPWTEGLAQISLTLEIERTSAFGRRMTNRRIRRDILDYPGGRRFCR